MQIAMFILGLILFIGLVIVHEWGHYKAARRNGVEVEEFGLGLPPRAWGKKRKDGMMLSVNWLPLGGFVKLKGEHDADTAKGSFGAASLKAKTKIMLAGVTMNLAVGVFILMVLALVGMPKLLTYQTVGEEQFTVKSDTKIVKQQVQSGYIQQGSPAQKMGLNARDIILSVASGNDVREVKTIGQLHNATKDFGGQKVSVKYLNGSATLTGSTTLLSKAEVDASLKTDDPKGYLGVSPQQLQIQRSTWSAPIVAIGFTAQLTKLTFIGLGHALAGLGAIISGAITNNHVARENGQSAASSQVGGPVAIGAILWGYSLLGINFILFIIAIISLTLAIMNILPIPALDGGRLFVIWIARILKKPLSQSTEELIQTVGMITLLALFALITLVDVKRFF